MSVPLDSHFSSLSIERLISNVAESLDRSVSPEASTKRDSQAVCPCELRSTTLFQRHARHSAFREALTQQLEVRENK